MPSIQFRSPESDKTEITQSQWSCLDEGLSTNEPPSQLLTLWYYIIQLHEFTDLFKIVLYAGKRIIPTDIYIYYVYYNNTLLERQLENNAKNGKIFSVLQFLERQDGKY